MTVFIEISGPWQWRPGLHVSNSMVRVWWGAAAVGVLRVPFKEFATHAWIWRPSR